MKRRRVVDTFKTCAVCGTSFPVFPSTADRKRYCSKACMTKDKAGEIKRCEHCGAEFYARRSVVGRARYCSRSCNAARTLADAPRSRGKGPENPRWQGGPAVYTCKWCSMEFTRYGSNEAMTCSRACASARWRSQRVAAGYSRLADKDTLKAGDYGPEWGAIVRAIHERDEFRCIQCGAKPRHSRHLHVHHLQPVRLFHGSQIQEANDPANLVSLCGACHRRVHTNQSAVEPLP